MSCITEILKLKGDKEVMLPLDDKGEPWIAVEGGGKYKDYEFIIVLNTLGHRCGYVAIPPEHKFSKTPIENRKIEFGDYKKEYQHYDYDNLNIDCHGGLTFMSPNHSLKTLLSIPCTDMWIGFDCGHCDDASDFNALEKYFGHEESEVNKKYSSFRDGVVRDFPYVVNECHKIIDQLIEKAA